jgi:membrane-associated phospholipid phosphatase
MLNRSDRASTLHLLFPRFTLLAGLAFGVLSLVVMPWDMQLVRIVQSDMVPESVDRVLHLTEAFAHGIGVIVILTCLWWVDIGSRPRWYQAVCIPLLAGISVLGLKQMTHRLRPHSLDLVDQAAANNGWLSGLESHVWSSSHHSFPSGHTTSGMALALALIWIYPRGAILFLGLAGATGAQRLVSQAHYLSDVLAGASLACLCACLCSWWWNRSGSVNLSSGGNDSTAVAGR